jgi:hypothetical protein
MGNDVGCIEGNEDIGHVRETADDYSRMLFLISHYPLEVRPVLGEHRLLPYYLRREHCNA